MFPYFANRIINVWNYILSTVNSISLARCRRSSHLINLSANLKYNVARALFNRFYTLNHKKRDILFLTINITLDNLRRFL